MSPLLTRSMAEWVSSPDSTRARPSSGARLGDDHPVVVHEAGAMHRIVGDDRSSPVQHEAGEVSLNGGIELLQRCRSSVRMALAIDVMRSYLVRGLDGPS